MIEHAGDPCGPHWRGYRGPLHEGFLHWTGDGSHLVFNQADTLWTLDIESGSMLMLVDADATYDVSTHREGRQSLGSFLYGFYADVSPDGSYVVYSSCEFAFDTPVGNQYTEGYELVMMNVGGTEKTRLTSNHNLDHFPVFSPDGRNIVFMRYRYGWYPTIYPYSYPEWREYVHLAIRPSGEHGPGTALDATKNVALYPPVWSPDGQTIAYMVDEGVWDPELAVWTIGTLEAEPVRIGNAVSPPTWSPDGEELAFISVEDGEVVLYSAWSDGTGQREVWRGVGEYGQAHWSPDGSEILVVTEHAYLVSVDGSDERDLTPDRPVYDDYTVPVSHAAWSPDGSWIALRDEFSISIVSRDGAEFHVLAVGELNGWPDWLQVVKPTQPATTAERATGSPTPEQPN